ncbi:hypothetical protein [Anaerosporobacter sp.]|uniref:hypothetical protein n=1 Tax=Anaerosporobacter sp. TaxID=1872529 RepID=UPI00286F9581|nr:hypothetical protein [Anaerosporobacter sp.]
MLRDNRHKKIDKICFWIILISIILMIAILQIKHCETQTESSSNYLNEAPKTKELCKKIELNQKNLIDLNNDGKFDEVDIYFDGVYINNRLFISINGDITYITKAKTFEHLYLLKTENNKIGILFEAQYNNGLCKTYLYQIDDNRKVIIKEEIEGSIIPDTVTSSGVVIGKHMNLFGNWYGTCKYEITPNLQIKAIEDIQIENDAENYITLKRDLVCDRECKKNERLYPVATNGMDYMYFKTEEGELVCIEFANIEHQIYVEDVLIEELFDGLGTTDELWEGETTYTIIKKSYMENMSYVEYPQIIGLKDKEKQDRINNLLRDRVLTDLKIYTGEPFADFSDPGGEYNFDYRLGFFNDYIFSCSCYIDGYWEYLDEKGEPYNNMSSSYRTARITIDMTTGEEITLTDFMMIDERLIDRDDGTNQVTDYNSAINPIFYTFRDAFWIYTSEEEENFYHSNTPQEIIERLNNPEEETCWYIDKDKKIAFFYLYGGVDIPYIRLSDLIYPKYLKMLE